MCDFPLSLSLFIWISPFRKKTLTDFYEVLWNFSLFFFKKNLFMEIYSGDLSLEYLFMEICPLKICSGDLSLEYLFMEIFQLKIFSRDLSLWSDIFLFFWNWCHLPSKILIFFWELTKSTQSNLSWLSNSGGKKGGVGEFYGPHLFCFFFPFLLFPLLSSFFLHCYYLHTSPTCIFSLITQFLLQKITFLSFSTFFHSSPSISF